MSAQFSLFTLTPEQFVCSSHPWFYCALWSAFGLPRIPSFSHSASLSVCICACCCSEHNSRRRSLFMGVLSHSDTHHLNRHMAGCGCHEILIPCSITVLFSTTVLLIFYFSRWGWGWVYIGSFESMRRTTIVSDGTWCIHHQSSFDFSSEDRFNTCDGISKESSWNQTYWSVRLIS